MEIWKDILNYEGLYQVSNYGNVRSVDRYVEANSRWGILRKMLFKGKQIKKFLRKNGYLGVSLSNKGKVITKDIHRMVYEAFNGKIPDGIQVNHKDENKENNNLSNLELLTPKENTNYGTGIERMKQSKSKHVYQYTLDGSLVAEYESTKQAAINNNYGQASISACARGKKHCYTYKGYKWSYEPL